MILNKTSSRVFSRISLKLGAADGGNTKRGKYEAWWTSRKDARTDKKFIDWALRLLQAESKGLLLDVACGVGDFIVRAEKAGLRTVGIDFSKESLTTLPSHHPTAKVLGDAHVLPFPEGSFDRVVCLGSLEHFEDPSKAVLEMSRVVKTSTGRCLIFVPNTYFLGHIFMVMRRGEPPDEGQQLFAERFGTKMEWHHLLEQSGLRVLSVHKYNRIWNSTKVGLGIKLIYNLLIRPVLPTNLSYAWAFVCEKSSMLDGSLPYGSLEWERGRKGAGSD